MQTSSPNRILFFSLEHWDDVWRRNQFICDGLLRRHPDLEILWVGPATDLWRSHPGVSSTQKLGIIYKPSADLPRLTALRPYKPLPNIIGKWLNQTCLKIQVNAALQKLGWQKFITWVNDQSTRNILPLPHSTCIVYDVTDDWTKSSLPPRILGRIKNDDQWLLDNAQHVIVCSTGLYQSKVERRPTVQLIRNGVNVRAYAPDTVKNLDIPKEIQFGNSKVACYLGTLHEDRLDIPLILHLLQTLPAVQFVFVGPNALSGNSIQQLSKFSNCHLLGGRPYSELPAYINGSDLFINPHVVTEFTESLDPLKLYEYMATGKPIVSTACAVFRDMEPLVKVASNAEEFAKLVLDESTATNAVNASAERIAWAEQHTWESRLAQVEQILGM